MIDEILWKKYLKYKRVCSIDVVVSFQFLKDIKTMLNCKFLLYQYVNLLKQQIVCSFSFFLFSLSLRIQLLKK